MKHRQRAKPLYQQPNFFVPDDGRPDAILIDCDGTITGEEYLPFVVGFTLSRFLGEKYNHARFQKVFHENVGGGFDKYYNKYVEASAAAGEDVSGYPNENVVVSAAVAWYVRLLEKLKTNPDQQLFTIRKGMIHGLQHAANQGIPLVVVTNASPAIVQANLAAAGIYVRGQVPDDVVPNLVIDAIVNKSDFPDPKKDRKPGPYPYAEGAPRKLGAILSKKFGHEVVIRPERCIGGEDSRNGHESMLRAMVRTRIHFGNDRIAQPFTFAVNGLNFATDFVVSKDGMSARAMQDILNYHAEKMRKTGQPVHLQTSRDDLLVQTPTGS
ncbi:MAG TPA: HAD family hydrolase, partial [Alphaproteobacteria bacterium]|nr:HAD family hydrolase [Alphaproteobacteria bacterium]